MAEDRGEALDGPAREPGLTRDADIEDLHRTIGELAAQVATALDAVYRAEETAHQADQRAADALCHVQYAAVALGLSFGIALTLLVLAVIPGGQL